jgi:glycosyltransferase involved in cell wall biosynthesis/SAM-dependent methyltransferase
MTCHSSIHVVQVSADDSVFDSTTGSESRRRQCLYGSILQREAPGSTMTLIVMTRNREAAAFTHDAVTFLPLCVSRTRRLRAVYRGLEALDLRRPIDVVTVQNPDGPGAAATAFATQRGIPVVGQLHYDFFNPAAAGVFGARWIRPMRRRLAQAVLTRCAALRVVGPGTADAARRAGIRSRIEVLPVPVEMASQPSVTSGRRERRVLFVGRIQPEKNLRRWLAVAARLASDDPALRFDIVGNGSQRREIERQARELGLSEAVTFHGFVPYEQLGPLYARASVFLLTSDHEGFGRVLVESYCHETPAVAVRTGGIEDIVVDGETGFLRDVTDVEGLAAAVRTLLDDADLARRMGQAGASHVRRQFDPDALASRWVQLLVDTAHRVLPARKLVLMPRPRTMRRWWRVIRSQWSLLRALEYEAVNGLVLKGRTLDIGGGNRNTYHNLLTIDGPIDSVNIDPKIDPTCVVDLNRPLPLRDGSYDNVLSLNTFEHIAEDERLVSESLRVLKPGGHFHIVVPFLYRVHGSPFDYHRHTAQWWRDQIAKNGTAGTEIVIEPLVWDRMMSAFSLWEVSRLARGLVMLISVVRDVRWWNRDRLPALPRHRIAVDYPVGYYIRGRK